jgi:hypothetical protein
LLRGCDAEKSSTGLRQPVYGWQMCVRIRNADCDVTTCQPLGKLKHGVA